MSGDGLRDRISKEFANTFYSSLGTGPQNIVYLFAEDSVMDHLFLDQGHRRSEGQNAIAITLSEIYRDGIKITIRRTFYQNSPLFPYLVVTIIGLFTYNHSSWPFVHVFYITSTFFPDHRFCITNSILYDCINPSQILNDNTLSLDTHSNVEFKEENIMNNFKPFNTLIDACDRFSVSDTKSYQPKTLNIQSKTVNQTTNDLIHLNGTENSDDVNCRLKGINQDGNEEGGYESSQLTYDNQKRDVTDCSSYMGRFSEEFDLQNETSTEYSYDVNSLYVGGYPDNTNSDDLYRVFSKYGPIQGVKMYDSKKMAFITFKNSNSTTAALKDGEIKLGDKSLRVQQKRIINNVKHIKRENLEIYGYNRDNNNRKVIKPKKY